MKALHALLFFSHNLTSENRHTVQRLNILLSRDAIDAVYFDPSVEESLQRVTIHPAPAASYVKSIEDAIYTHPELLSDYDAIDVYIDTDRYTMVPRSVAEDSAAMRDIADSLYPSERLNVVCTCAEVPPFHGDDGGEAFAAMFVSPALEGFLRRTFVQARIMHRMVPLTHYFEACGRLLGNAGKMHIHRRAEAVDIIAFDGKGLTMANTFATAGGNDDAVYYALAAAKDLGFDADNDRMMCSGEAALRDRLMARLKPYVNFVMPVIFPTTALHLGAEAAKVPFELLSLTLCE